MTPGQGLRELARLRERAGWQTKVNKQMESIIIIMYVPTTTTYLSTTPVRETLQVMRSSTQLDEVGQPSLGKVDNKLLDKPRRTRICSTF